MMYNLTMQDTTIVTTSPVGQHLEKIADGAQVSYLMFNKKKINLVAKMSIGRSPDCNIVVDNKLASRVHASIQKIRDVSKTKIQQMELSSMEGAFPTTST